MPHFWSRPKFIFWAVVVIFMTIIIAQNAEPTSIDLFFWSIATFPKWSLILISMLIGSLLTLAGFFHFKRNRNTFTPE